MLGDHCYLLNYFRINRSQLIYFNEALINVNLNVIKLKDLEFKHVGFWGFGVISYVWA